MSKDLIEELQRVSKEYCSGDAPTVDDMNDFGKYSHGKYFYNFDSWNNALREAGFSVNECKGEYNVNEDRLLEELWRVAEEINKSPTMKEFENHSKWNRKRYCRTFGSWNESLEEAGLSKNSKMNISKEEIDKEMENMVKHFDGKVPHIRKADEFMEISYTTVFRQYGSWLEALDELGYEWEHDRCGEKHHNWKGGYGYYYGPSWWKRQEEALERDKYTCQCCGKSKKELGRNPDVHHIKPASEWIVEEEHQEMNNLDNLICLCTSCHHKYEGEWKDLSYMQFREKLNSNHEK